jgi:Na+-driven multidrug efflux pump
MIILVCIFPGAIARIYTDIPDLVKASIPAIIVMTSSYLINIPGQVVFMAVSGTGSTRTAFRLELIALGVYMLYCYIVVGTIKADVAICWTAEHVYAGFLFLCGWMYMRSGRWKDRRI